MISFSLGDFAHVEFHPWRNSIDFKEQIIMLHQGRVHLFHPLHRL